jgi:CHAT domain-containing protein
MKILYFTANPELVVMPKDPENLDEAETKIAEYTKLDLWPELKEVANVFYEGRMDGDVQLEVVPEARAEDVVRYVERFRPDIVHFSGHGEEKRLIISDSDYFAGETLAAKWLKETLQNKGVSLLVLNCCWSESFVNELKDTVGLVIGANERLKVDKAQAFAAKFYSDVRDGLSLGEAFTRAATVSEQYTAKPQAGPVWEQPIVTEPAVDEVVTRLIEQRSELVGLKVQISTELVMDTAKVFAGLMVAFIAWWVLEGSSVKWLLGDASQPLWALFDEETQKFAKAWGGQEWIAREPFALFFILLRKPVARLTSHAWSQGGLVLAIKTLDFSLLTHQWAKKHQVEARIDGVINWVKETARGQ